MASSATDEDVDLACRMLQKSIGNAVSKARKRRRFTEEDEATAEEVDRLVRHSNHVLRTLAAKRSSLSSGVRAFREASGEHLRRFGDLLSNNASGGGSCGNDNDKRRKEEQHRILRRWFAIYLRLRDGFVLLESGERRHARDGDDIDGVDVSASLYRSVLSGALRGDGTTRKFSSERGYTGAGYDEFHDEDVGLRRRLLDALGRLTGKSRDAVADRTFDRDGNGAQLWQSVMDGVSETSGLRRELGDAKDEFVGGMNRLLLSRHGVSTGGGDGRGKCGRGGSSPELLKLVTDDKAERITLGMVDIAREGNAFTIGEAGGSLPFGMTVQDWRRKFSLGQQKRQSTASSLPSSPQSKAQAASAKPKQKKKRKVILDDSSDEEDGGATHAAPPPAKQMKRNQCAPPANDRDGGGGGDDDGLAVRVREATDARRSKSDADADNDNTASVNAMKLQHGVDNARLERGRERLEDEQLRSKLAAEDEDLREELLGGEGTYGGGGGGGGTGMERHAPLLKACLESKSELMSNEVYTNDSNMVREAQDRCWGYFTESISSWKESFQELLRMRRDVKDGTLEVTSNEAYTVRDKFREDSINLGNDCIKVHEHFFPLLDKQSPLRKSMSKVCHAYIRFAKETFQTALNLVKEQERCSQAATAPVTIDMLFEKGQHILLRGRAHHNIGRALYELAQYYKYMSSSQPGGGRDRIKDLMKKAGKEFDDAAQTAKAVGRNSVVIRGHANAQAKSSQNNCSWEAEGWIHYLEAIKLGSLAGRLNVACLCKLDLATKDVEERFGAFFGSIDTPDVLKASSIDGVTHLDVAEAVDDMYCFAMTVAELLYQCLDNVAMNKRGRVDTMTGDKLLLITRKAMKRAASISEQLLVFLEKGVPYYETEHIATKGTIEEEESELVRWWEMVKALAQKNVSDIVQKNLTNNAERSALPRADVTEQGGISSRSASLQEKIFINVDRTLQHKTPSCRSRGVKKKDSMAKDRAVAERFKSAFGSDGNDDAFEETDTRSPSGQQRSHTAMTYRKWGDEMLSEDQQKCLCPALPDDLPTEVRMALEKKLRDVLPIISPSLDRVS